METIFQSIEILSKEKGIDPQPGGVAVAVEAPAQSSPHRSQGGSEDRGGSQRCGGDLPGALVVRQCVERPGRETEAAGYL